MAKPNIGHIDFINCLPLTYSFQAEGFDEGLHVQYDVPSALNRGIVSGQLDISPVSSIVYARNSEKLLILPDVSITADGDVQSILLVAKKPITELTDDSITLTAKSATSHCLLKMILQKGYGARPHYMIQDVDMAQIISQDAAATLLIGDDALYAYHNRQAGLYYYDIGREWKKLSGQRMVYALWVVDRAFAAQKPEQLQLAYEKIIRGFQNGYQKKAQAIERILPDKPFSFTQLADYLEVIKWDFQTEHQNALLTFYKLAHEMQLIDSVPELELAEVVR